MKVAEVYVDAAAVLGLIGIEVMEGEVGGRLDVSDLALVAIQRNQVYAGACLGLPVKLHVWSFTNGQSSLQKRTFITSLISGLV